MTRLKNTVLNWIRFASFLKSYRSQSSDKYKSVDKIRLPFKIQTQKCPKFSLDWFETPTRAVYVELCGQEEHCRTTQDTNSFEIC